MKFKLIKFESVKSTNDEAIKIIKKNKFNSCIITSKKQTKGRGTRGKKWISKKGNIFISLFFEVDLKKTKPEKFAILNPRIIKNILSKYSKYRITIKWPNDLLVKKRKLCGILQEVIEHNNKKFLIIGIGINIVSNPSINKKYKATNIFMQTKKKPDKKRIIDLIINSYENFFSDLKSYNFIKIKKKANLMALN